MTQYYGRLNENKREAAYIEIMTNWILDNFGNPVVLSASDIPLLAPLKKIHHAAYTVAVATTRHSAPHMIYDTERPLVTRQQATGECPLCGRSKDICDGNCTCPECKGNGFDGYCMDCKVCDGTGIIIAEQPQPDSE